MANGNGGQSLVYNHLPQIIAGLRDATLLGLDHAAATLEQEAAAEAPVLSGALRASHYRITPVHDGYDAAVGAMTSANPKAMESGRPPVEGDTAIVGFAAHYAVYVHDGHHTRSGSWVPGQPFLLEPAQRMQGELAGIVMQDVQSFLQGM